LVEILNELLSPRLVFQRTLVWIPAETEVWN
jgi:hypothetical protein